MSTPIPIPLINGVRHGYSSIELKLAGQIFIGFKSINYSFTRTRADVYGNHPSPIAKTRGTLAFKADCEIYLAEWNLFQSQLGKGWGEVAFSVLVTHGETGFDTIVDELVGCHVDGVDASNSQGNDPLVRKLDLNPINILYNGIDQNTFPLVPPLGG